MRNNMHKVGRSHSDKETVNNILLNHEKTAQQFYLEKKPDTGCQEPMDAIRLAADRLHLEEDDEDFDLRRALKNSKASSSALSLPPKIDEKSDFDDNTKLSQFFHPTRPAQFPLTMANAASSAPAVASNSSSSLNMPQLSKEQLLFLAMKQQNNWNQLLMKQICAL